MCSLCQPGATGPQDCGLVYLVMDDDEARDVYNEYRRAARAGRDRVSDRGEREKP
ncbi:MAG: DUF6767 domain-containing protein [Propioniciclava sp.]